MYGVKSTEAVLLAGILKFLIVIPNAGSETVTSASASWVAKRKYIGRPPILLGFGTFGAWSVLAYGAANQNS